ncbi:MAG: HAMP domain-containing protein [Chloroflexi bacterium]|nr:HAMP domain-containing protein [Chloroflexota bacterium]
MTLLKRTLLLVISLLVVTVLITAGVVAVSARQSILAQAEMDARVITQEFARAVGFAEEIGQELEAILAQQQSAEANLASLLPMLARATGLSEEQLKAQMTEVTGYAALQDFAARRIEQGVWLSQFVDHLLSENVSAIWIVDRGLTIELFSAVPDWQQESVLKAMDRDAFQTALKEERIETYYDGRFLKVVAPITDVAGTVTGGTLLAIPIERVEDALRQQLQLTALVAAVVLSVGLLASVILTRRVTQPVARLTATAADIEAGTFEVEKLTGIAQRPDELGQLARVFQRMAREVYAREQRLKQEVQQLRIEIDEVKKARQVEEITETEYFQHLREHAAKMRERTTGE